MARGDDAGNLKSATVTWVDEIFGPSIPALKPNSKDERGLDNVNTGHLLCPIEFDWEDSKYVNYWLPFGSLADPNIISVRAMILEGHADHGVTANSWPRFLVAGYKYNEGDVDKGLFQSALMVKVRVSVSL